MSSFFAEVCVIKSLHTRENGENIVEENALSGRFLFLFFGTLFA